MRYLARKITVVLALGWATLCVADDRINWAPNIDQARLMAAQQNKLLLIHFWTPTCGPCKTIDRNVFPHPAVAKAINDNYVPLKVNAFVSKELTAHFKVQQWPTDIISTVDGDALHSMVTDQNAMRYVQKLSTLARQHAIAAQYRTRVNQPTKPEISVAGSSTLAATQNHQQPAYQQPAYQPTAQQQPGYQSQIGQMPNASPGHTLEPMAGNMAVAQRPGTNFVSRSRINNTQTQPGPSVGQSVANETARYSAAISNPYAVQPQPFQQASPATTPATNVPPANGLASAPAQSQAVPRQTQPAVPAAMAAPPAIGAQPPVADRFAGGKPAQLTSPEPSSAFQAGTVQQGAMQPRVNQQAQPQRANAQTQIAQRGSAPPQQVAPSVKEPSFENPRPQPPHAAMTSPAVANANTAPSRDITPIPPTKNPPIGLEGRCPVWLITKGSWKKGDERWGAVHRGVTYLFSSQEAQQKFLSAPDDFSPYLAGMDIVRLAADGAIAQGTRKFGVLFDDDGAGPRKSRMFLFDSVETRNQFESEPDRYLQPVMQAMQNGQLDRLLR